MSLYPTIMSLLQKYAILYEEFDHDPILTYEDAAREQAKRERTGRESKNVFLTDKNGLYALFVTVQGVKVDFTKLKETTGHKRSIASPEDVTNVIHCTPGCVAPFGFDENILTIIDPQIYTHDAYLFSPGVTTKTIECNPTDLQLIFASLQNKITL